jgi:D-lactate dehydrogenase (cytochrome)
LRLPERVSTQKPSAAHQDESFHTPHPPDVVVWPESAEISAILSYANQERLPVTPWSGGSSLEGNPIPVCGGILLALYNMNKILQIHEADQQVVVQPGVVYDALNARLARHGLVFPPAPGSADVATIGGMVGNNSSGMHAVRYGVTGLCAVAPGGAA